MEQHKERTVTRFENGAFTEKRDRVVIEEPITIHINGREFITIVCTPEWVKDMAVGFLASEGIIPNHQDIKEIRLDEKAGIVHITADKVYPFYEQLQNKRFVSSCCGMSRQGFVFAHDAITAKTMKEARVKLTPEDCFRLMRQMDASAETFRKTGGVHNAALCSTDGFFLSRVDIGRHNALDKIYGHCLRNGIPVRDKVIVFSGRISSEILLKVAKIGCEVILSKSAPTELALELAEELGITAVGFIRGESFNLYTHPERIAAGKAGGNPDLPSSKQEI
ncbi:formate dehydrogenase accessory sulfurtransferase FdhD [Planomicrobium sp. CPCC 101110]|uniref:formate dehydrogenase accessory sulfurtransferase FdhD n=1 Tax=Planomicrobium sp. CPCC 101110 TaxID=2599619 RepID=UPI0011B7FE1C|nr:formate dehydrogenase accessory sulfurtransferase FdhD [Planomicrobium sp. CPCC 101110]TWT27231.1 formate dehydrogenase accessory sulfurtransferase FdhD [Planomicrobium sp. CPCC 101110]